MHQPLLRYARLFFITLDVLMLNILLFSGKWWFGNLPDSYDIEYYQVVAFLNVLWFIVSWVKNLYQTKYISSFEIFSRETLRAYLFFIACAILYLYFDRRIKISRLFLGVEFIAIAAGFMCNRLLNLVFFKSFLIKIMLREKY